MLQRFSDISNLIHLDHRKIRIAMAQPEDRDEIYQMRHDVYAQELGQHKMNGERLLSDPLDTFNRYITARMGDQLLGFISITPPGFNQYSIDKYLPRSALPFNVDHGLYEVRILTVDKACRGGRVASLLMYAAFRWIEEQRGRRVVAIGRKDVLSIYQKLGLQHLHHTIRAGAVTYELLAVTVAELRNLVEHKYSMIKNLSRGISWELDISYTKSACCFHGGAFFDAIGVNFDTLERKHSIVNADVLDAWFPPAPGVINTLSEHLPWLLNTSPPTAADGMRETIAQARGVTAENILPGAGSSDLIYLAFLRWLKNDDTVLLLDPTYGEYAHVLEHVIQCNVRRLTLRRSNHYVVDLDELVHASAGCNLTVLVNPNSPTGQHIPRQNLEEALMRISGSTRVWIDETYIEYVGAHESLEGVAVHRPNIVVCKSMSKVYALSGVRAAYLCGDKQQISGLVPFSPPWAVSLPAQVASVRALQEPEYYAERYEETHRLRAALVDDLHSIGIDEIVPSVANFVMCHLAGDGPDAASLVKECAKRGVFLRDVSSMGVDLGPRALRIAVKDERSNRAIVETLADVFSELVKSSAYRSVSSLGRP